MLKFQICDQILEISTEQWHLIMRKLRTDIHKIDCKLEQLIERIFAKLNNIEDTIEFLINTIHLKDRPILALKFSHMANQVFHLYKTDSQFSKNHLLSFANQFIPILPIICGHILIHKLTFERLHILKKVW